MLEDTYTLFLREMLIFKKSIAANFLRALIFPIMFIIFMSAAGGTPQNVPVAVVNYDNGPIALSFTNQLQAASNIKIISYTTQQHAMALLLQGDVVAVVVIPEGFSSGTASEVYVYLDGSQPQSSDVVSNFMTLLAAKFDTRIAFQSTPRSAAPGTVSILSNYAYGAGSNYKSYAVGGIIIMVAAFGSVFGTGFTILSDRQLGNLKAFLTAPINRSSILLSKILYGTVQSAFSAYIGLVVGLLFGAKITTGVVGFVELLWILLLTSLGFGALSVALASRIKQLQTYALISLTVTLPLSFIGGAFIPVSLLPPFLQSTVIVNPTYYAINAVRAIMIKGSLPFNNLLVNSMMLILFAIIMTIVAAILFRQTSEQL